MPHPATLIPADIRFPLERANGIQIVKTAAALARSGMPTRLMVRRSDSRPTDELLALYGIRCCPNLEVRRLRVLHRRGSYLVPRASFLLQAIATSVAAHVAGELVLTRDLQLADLLLRLGSLRVVYEAHAVESLLYQERGALYGTAEKPNPRKTARIAARECRVWHRSAGIVTTTGGIRDSFTEQHGRRERVHVVPNGCDVTEDRLFPGLARDQPPRVVYAGQLYPWKGVDVLVEAMTAVPGARLVIVGGIEGERDIERIRALVSASGLAARTDLLGTVPQAQVATELHRAAVVAVPFLHSGMTERHTSPIKAFEAMAAGRPIVTTALPSACEFLRDGENALLVPPGDATGLAAAINRLLEDRDLARRLAGTAFAQAPQYSWDARAAKLRALFKEIA